MTAVAALPAPLGRADAACAHCGQPLAAGEVEYCCEGCRAVSLLLREEGLERYYDLCGARTAPVGPAPAPARQRAWLEPLADELAAAPSIQRVSLSVQGLRCTGCVWLLEELFRRQPDGAQIAINPALGAIDLDAGKGFPLAAFADAVERFGYQLGPARAAAPDTGDVGLLLRLGICAALAGNSMMLASAFYLGLDGGPLHQLFLSASWAMAALSVGVGGPVFFRSAWAALRQRIVHLDAPISLGILLAFAGSTWGMVSGSERAVYFDTVSVFIALMLLGRVLQERVLAANRRRLLADDGVDAILCRRVQAGAVQVVRCGELAAGDEILVPPGDLVPVEASLERAAADLSLDWVTGESAPRRFAAGDRIPAGAFNAGRSALHLRAAEPFSSSALVALLRAPARGRGDEPGAHASRLSRRIAGLYVVAVLAVAGLGALAWVAAGRPAAAGLEVATSVLVVTCPCAFGIALPLGHELVQAGLRRQGMYVKSADFVDRARAVRHVVFDKTGTLTSGRLELADPGALAALAEGDRAALHDLAARSNHPRSQAVRRALEQTGAPALRDIEVIEEPGAGVAATVDGHQYRLGRPAWAAPDQSAAAELAFSRDGRAIAWLATDEHLRPDAAREIAALRAAGYRISILSGDRPERVRAIAGALGIDPARAHGAMRPEDKARWLAGHDRGDTLFIGDGINDGLAAGAAHLSGTPAIDRPFMATRCDFYLTAAGLAPIGSALAAAHRLARVARRNLVFTTAYNAGAVGLALAGLMRPWLAAVLMPLSSLTVVVATTRALSGRRTRWT